MASRPSLSTSSRVRPSSRSRTRSNATPSWSVTGPSAVSGGGLTSVLGEIVPLRELFSTFFFVSIGILLEPVAILAASIALIWGASFFLIDIALDSFRPGVIAAGRVLLGALALSLVPAARRSIDRDRQIRSVIDVEAVKARRK